MIWQKPAIHWITDIAIWIGTPLKIRTTHQPTICDLFLFSILLIYTFTFWLLVLALLLVVKIVKFRSIEDIFSWIFQISDDAAEDSRGRLKFSLEYELTNNRKDVYAPRQNRATALIPIRAALSNTLIPVVKVRFFSRILPTQPFCCSTKR